MGQPEDSGAEIVGYRAELLDGILALAAGEGWPSLAEDRERAGRVLDAPGVTTVVATATALVFGPGDRAADEDGDGAGNGHVVGFAQFQSDGEIQAHLSVLVVAPAWRRQGLGRRLVNEGLRRAGGIRVDLVTDSANAFYRSLPHRRLAGYRIYPPEPDDSDA